MALTDVSRAASSADELPVLSFAPDPGHVALDLDRLVATRLLIQASSGGGKSYALRWLLEQTHGRIQQFVLDWEGEFASLRERFAYVLAGQDGDVPADPRTAGLLCQRLLELGASAVVDLSELQPEDRQRFAQGFLHELMHVPRSLWRPLLVAIDEAHYLAPEKGEPEAVSKTDVVALCTQGRKRGFAAVLATQRIAKVSNNALADLLNVLIGPTSFDLDVKRAGDTLGFDKMQREQLKRLEPGQFFARGPALAREPVLVRTGPVQTTHPQPGRVAPPVPPPPEAIRALLGQLRDLPAQTSSEPDEIEQARGRIAELERALRERPVEVRTETIVERVEVPAIDVVTLERLEALATGLRDTGADMVGLGERLVAGLARVQHTPAPVPGGAAAAAATDRAVHEKRLRRVHPRPQPHEPAPHRAQPPSPDADDTLSRKRQHILDTLATFEALGLWAVDRKNVAVFSGRGPRSSAFDTDLAALGKAGLLVTGGGQLHLTDAGRARAATPAALPTGEDFRQAWYTALTRALGGNDAQARLLRVLAAVFPAGVSRADLAERAGMSVRSSAFDGHVAALSSLGLARTGGGQVTATDLLFPELPAHGATGVQPPPRRAG